jgi:branched-chain amino acid transport system ATP-binding protein
MPLLELRKLTKHFGGVVAVNELDLSIEKGEFMGLIGPNGAGKTTVFNVVSGMFSPSNGRVFFKGEDITGLKPHRVAQKGLVRTFQQTILVGEMTVMQNIFLASHLSAAVGLRSVLLGTASTRLKEKSLVEKAEELVEFMGLGEMRYELAKNLPHGHQRALGVGMALAAGPELLMLDEPLTGLNAQETAEMLGRISHVHKAGTTILLVEHHMEAVMELCARICVLNFGKKMAEGTPKEILDNKAVIEAYLGAGYAAKRE